MTLIAVIGGDAYKWLLAFHILLAAIIPTSLTLVALGFVLLHESSGGYDLGQGWVAFGFVVWLLSFIAGAGYLGPESGRLSKLVEERGPEGSGVSAPARTRLRRLADRAHAADPGGARHGRQARALTTALR
jgi:hypothetical protein